MAKRHAHERDLERAAADVALALLEHPDWKEDALALRDRLDVLIDVKLTASNPASVPPDEGTPSHPGSEAVSTGVPHGRSSRRGASSPASERP